MKKDFEILDNEERLTSTELEEIIGGKKKLVIKCNFDIVICYVEETDSIKNK